MDNTHQLSIRLENIFRRKISTDFVVHCADDFDGNGLYDSVIFWCGVLVGNFVANKYLPLGCNESNNIKNNCFQLRIDLEEYKDKTWEDLTDGERDLLINKVSDFAETF